MNGKRKAIWVSALVCILLAAVMVFLLFPYAEGRDYAHLSVSVTDAYTLTPLEGAVVVLPEFDMRETTDTNGNARFINVPYQNAESLEKLLPADFGQTTILCYCDGYQPYALFYAEIQKNRMREGLSLFLFPITEESGCIIEAPPEEWVNELLSHYRPETP